MTTLVNLRNFPKGGYAFRDPAIHFNIAPGSALAMQGLDVVATALRTARLQNPSSGLDPDYDTCVEAIKRYTCQRIGNDPKFCQDTNATIETVAARKKVERARCKSCGSRSR